MACGDRYRSLIVNEFGYTPQKPCGAWCNDADHGAWNVAARALFGTVRKAYDAIPPPLPDTLAVDYTNYTLAVSQLEEPSGLALPGTQAERVAAAIATMNTGVCLLERAQDAITAAGGTPIDVPGATAPRPPDAPWWTPVVILGGAWLVWRAYQSRKATP